MKKKLFKYIKITLAITIIGALTLPSYAAVNAADGSAFVTKAEFDAALSDFNARLTTFEAGINSKIDSQVSSYLDRNGIWNGKAQTIAWNKDNIYGQVWASGTAKDAVVTGCYVPGITFTGARAAQKAVTVGKNDQNKWAVVYTISKSGLACISFDSLSEGIVRTGGYVTDAGDVSFQLNAYMILLYGFDFYEQKSGSTEQTKSYGWINSLTQAGGGAIYIPNNTDMKAYFFVTKGSKLLGDLRFETVRLMGMAVWDGDIKYKINIRSCVVY